MKVDHLYILAINGGGPTDEITKGVEALFARHPESLVVGIEPISHPTASNWKGFIEKDQVLSKAVATIKSQTSASPNIGVYVVTHGSVGCVGGTLLPKGLAKLISELGFVTIRKLCLVVCTQAKVDQDSSPAEGFLGNLCTALQGRGLTPMIAGWTGFVSIAYDGIVPSLRPADSDKAAKTEYQQAGWGHKYLKTPMANSTARFAKCLPRRVTPEDRTKFKRVVQYQGGQVVAVGLDQWHDA